MQNFTTVGLIDGNFRLNLESTGMGFDTEIEAVCLAHEIDLYTSPNVLDPDQATAMTRAGADQLVAHVGLTVSGSIRAGVALSLDGAIERVMSIVEAGWKVRKDIILLCYSGPFDEPDTVGVALPHMPGVAGFFGASSIERLPTGRAISTQVESFKSIRLRA